VRLIKHRPQVTLHAPRYLVPGESPVLEARVAAERPVPVDYVRVDLSGTERATHGSGKNQTTHRTSVLALAANVLGETELPAGTHRFPCRFDLPADLPPSYDGRRVGTEYTATVRVSIPWWPDRVERYVMTVVPAPVAARETEPRVWSSDVHGPRGKEPHVEVGLARDVVVPGDVLSGTVALSNVAHNRYEAVQLTLCLHETKYDTRGRDRGTVRVREWAAQVPAKRAGEGEGIDARQARLAREREEATARTLAALGPLRRWLFRKLLGWAQRFGPHRADALFTMGAAWPTVRALALELGRRLTAAGSLDRADDVFYLETPALEAACAARAEGPARPEAREEAARQRALRAQRKRLHPPPMIPVGSRFRFGPFSMEAWETQRRNPEHAETLEGFAVSPGRVTGRASVILSPADFAAMEPGTILVCPATTPAWTPLFTRATALVTDIGGVLAHGSIVAREYGIPAVMGTGNATQRIVSGQTITVDGDTGTVALAS